MIEHRVVSEIATLVDFTHQLRRGSRASMPVECQRAVGLTEHRQVARVALNFLEKLWFNHSQFVLIKDLYQLFAPLRTGVPNGTLKFCNLNFKWNIPEL